MYNKFFKRIIDIILSFLGIIVTFIPMLIVALIIKISDPGPVFFKQKRFGKNKKFFNLLKFRSMKMNAPHDTPTHLLENPDQYITSVGKFLRKTSLDEIPQLLQIFTGKMSLIGPRPALWNQEDLIKERDKYQSNDIRLGLTGWAQVNGRDELEISEKARYDGEYVKRMSFIFDLKILFMTVGKVLKHDGVVEGGPKEKNKKKSKNKGV